MFSAKSSLSPFGLYVFDPYQFFSDPGQRNDQCPCENRCVYSATVQEFALHISLLSLLRHTMSLYIDAIIELLPQPSCTDRIARFVQVHLVKNLMPGQ